MATTGSHPAFLPLLLALVLLLLSSSFSAAQQPQPPSQPQPPYNRTAFDLYFGNRDLLNAFLYPRRTVTADAPYVVRYVLLQLVCAYDVSAACSASALSFLGVRLSIPSALCKDRDAFAATILHLTYRVLRADLPREGASLGDLLRLVGLLPSTSASPDGEASSKGDDPGDSDDDSGSPAGWAHRHARTLDAYFRSDGWNSRAFQPFSEAGAHKPYVPRNAATLDARSVLFPLRWSPAIDSTKCNPAGRCSAQVHVFAQLRRARPLLQSSHAATVHRLHWRLRQLHTQRQQLYKRRNSKRRVRSRADRRAVHAQIVTVVRASQRLTRRQKALTTWWESKLASTGIINLVYLQRFNLSLQERPLHAFAFLLGDAIAQHDTILLAFTEKVHIDAARPQPLVRRFGRDSSIGGRIRQWTSFLQAQPHSEFPSASAALCSASMGHVRAYGNDVVGLRRAKFLEFEGVVGRSVFNPDGLDPPVRVRFDTPEQAARQCGRSRVWAGVHFGPAVDAGLDLASDVGQKAMRHMQDLVNGRTPQGCERCGGRL